MAIKIARLDGWKAGEKNHYPQADGTCFLVEPRDPEEVAMVGGGKFAATLIGWGSPSTIAYGATPEQAIERYSAGRYF